MSTSSDPAIPPAGTVLVLTAMPLELEPLLAPMTARRVQRVEGRVFHHGEIRGRRVVLAMTGIGTENARITTELACGLQVPFAAALFSGVAGSVHNLADVVVPERWTADGGVTWFDVDERLLQLASALSVSGSAGLASEGALGDTPTPIPGVAPGTVITLPHEARLRVGGRGTTGDPFGDSAIPCVPGGGDVLGCATDPDGTVEAPITPEELREILRASFPPGEVSTPDPTTDTFDAQDMETAAVAATLERRGVPFLAVRGVSDGQGDPLGLDGFPTQFFAYRHLAAHNASLVTQEILLGAGER